MGSGGFSNEYRNEEKKLNDHLSSNLGITPKMTQNPGNDANKAFDPANRQVLLQMLDQDNDDRKNLFEALRIMDEARAMFDFIPKLDEHGEVIGEVPDKAKYSEVIMQYLKKLIHLFPGQAALVDSTDHIGEDIGSICEMSAQGDESQHHLWRYFLQRRSTKET